MTNTVRGLTEETADCAINGGADVLTEYPRVSVVKKEPAVLRECFNLLRLFQNLTLFHIFPCLPV
jgi:hypothetical protein